MSLDDVLSALNDLAPLYRFGALQEIRKARRPLQRLPSRHPFGGSREGWAHHVGGRGELQFNVAEENEGMLRWGVAVSLQASRSLPDVTVLYPKLRKLSCMLEVHGDHLHGLGFEMWDWTDGPQGRVRSPNRTPQCVPDHLFCPGASVFVGRQAYLATFDPACVLRDFDILLPVYEFVEFEPAGPPPALCSQRGFVFQPERGGGEHGREMVVTRTAAVSQVSLRHRAMQNALKSELEREGAIVSIENPDGRGGYIDVVACRDGDYEFYEVKTAASARLAIRHATGQLLEYAYWPEAARPKRLVVVAERPLDPDAADYLRTLKAEVGLVIEYRQVTSE